ncbi:MAG: hypothetical protein ABFS37_02585, partial [Acidobacteriota bacterium]
SIFKIQEIATRRAATKRHERAQKGKKRRLTPLLIGFIGVPYCLYRLSLRAFLRLFVAISPSSWRWPGSVI